MYIFGKSEVQHLKMMANVFNFILLTILYAQVWRSRFLRRGMLRSQYGIIIRGYLTRKTCVQSIFQNKSKPESSQTSIVQWQKHLESFTSVLQKLWQQIWFYFSHGWDRSIRIILRTLSGIGKGKLKYPVISYIQRWWNTVSDCCQWLGSLGPNAEDTRMNNCVVNDGFPPFGCSSTPRQCSQQEQHQRPGIGTCF